VTLKNEVAGKLVILAAPYLWRRYRSKAYIALGATASLLIARQVIKHVRTRTADGREAVRDRMVEPLPHDQQASPTPTPQAFVDSDQRDQQAASTAVSTRGTGHAK
jgi:hypothetical protein